MFLISTHLSLNSDLGPAPEAAPQAQVLLSLSSSPPQEGAGLSPVALQP